MVAKDIDEQEVKNFKGLLEYFKQLAYDGVTPLIEKQLLLMLDHAIPFFFSLIKTAHFDELKRFTINRNVLPGNVNHRIHDIKYLKYPPAGMVKKYGRCNLPGESVFYSSFLAFTALTEMRPKVGDVITETTWRPKNNETLTYCPIFKNQPPDEHFINPRLLEYEAQYEAKISAYPPNIREQIDALVQFIADAFTKSVHPDNHLDYIFSAYFSNKIFNTFENGRVEAIYYPSVREKLSFENVAIKPDILEKKYRLFSVKDSVVTQDLRDGRGGYFMSGLSECKSFDLAAGKIRWDTDPNKLHQPPEIISRLKFLYDIQLEENARSSIIVPPPSN